jgi:tetratricopeptide (TPR) repeat protein
MISRPTTRRGSEGLTVFLSHSTKDGAFVEKLAIALDDAGFSPWRCEVDIEKGDNFVAKINDGLAQSELALLVWSPDAANSAWTEQEWTTLLAQQVEQRKVRLAIILLRDHPRPALLRTSNHIDARWDEAGGIRQTLDWLKGRQQVQRFAGLRAPVYLPDYRPQDFVGRSTYLERLRDTFTTEPTVFLLYGDPGAGKSTLALRFAWEAQKDFDAVIFQTCGQRPLDAITAELADRLPIEVKTLEPDKQREAAKHWLRERQSLLVLDDVWSLDVMQLEAKPPCSVLYTSRRHALPGIAAKQSVEVERFTEAEAEELFHTYLDPVFGEGEVIRNREALMGFAQRVELLPIAVAVGASLLREKAASGLGRAVPRLHPGALTDGVKDVPGLFRKAIAAQPEPEQKLLAAGAVCVQEGFWLPLAAGIAKLSEDEADDAADRLVHSSLLRVADRERRRFSLHALLREQVRAEQGEDIVKLQERHAAALEELFNDRESRWKDCRECLEEIIPGVKFLVARGESGREWQLGYKGYSLARRIGELETALRIMQQEEAIGTESSDNNYLQASYGNQALILTGWGRLEEALALHKKEEEICRELGSKDGLQASYGNQANIFYAWGRLEEALALHKKKEEICRELGKKNSLAISYGNQAPILRAWGRLEEALALHKKEEEICIELGVKDGLQACYGNQALILQAWGRLEEALALHKKEEDICRELGDKDGLAIGYGNQADILRQQGKLDDALELYKKKEALCLELGKRGSLGYCYWGWGVLARAQGDRQTEKEKLEQALAIFTELKMPRERDAVQKELEDSG